MHIETWVPDEILRDMASRFAKIVHPDDRLVKSASVVQAMKHLAGEVNRLPVIEQDDAYEAFNADMNSIRELPPNYLNNLIEAAKEKRAAEKALKRKLYEERNNNDGKRKVRQGDGQPPEG